MSKSSAGSVIRLRGVRHNNLKNFDLDLPLKKLIVITGLSGSGKSSLAFDTLFAEGQRRYIETFSPYARQFFDRMDKPQVDSIEGIPPAIAIEQRNAVKSTRSTVGTMTEVCDYMKVLWPHIAQLHCRQCGKAVRKDSPRAIWSEVQSPKSKVDKRESEVLITFELPLSEKLSLDESLALTAKQGYQRLLLGDEILRLDEFKSRVAEQKPGVRFLTVIQDRVKIADANRARFIEACEQAYHFGKGKLAIQELHSQVQPRHSSLVTRHFSNRLHCAECDFEYREPSPALFSFNHPLGACPTCRGFGRVISIDYDLAIPDRTKTLAGGAIKPWQSGHSIECQQDLMKFCRTAEIPTDIPFAKLPKKFQTLIIEGEPDYGSDEEHEWPRAWYGVKGYFRWLETKAYKMHVRVLLSRYRAYTTCSVCKGARFQPDTLLYLLTIQDSRLTLANFYALPIRDSLNVIEQISAKRKLKPNDPIALAFSEVRSRLGYLNDVGLGYLTLDRTTRSLSGGETERVNLTTCLGTRLVNTLFILDEPSVGLHPRDTERLVRILEQLRDAGNTVVVVEHEPSVMRAADQIVDLGPGHGATGGEIVFQGTHRDILKSHASLTGQYLSGKKQIDIPARRDISAHSKSLRLENAARHNLKNLNVEIPLNRFVCVTGVSGSGKTTLIKEVLLPALEANLKTDSSIKRSPIKASERIESSATEDDDSTNSESTVGNRQWAIISGYEHLHRVALVDQSILGKTPRSNPAVYIGAFDDIREVFALTEVARQRGLNASAFSFNSAQGQCERCRGAGFEKIEMQFLSDVFIRCPSCDGRRYRPHILEIKAANKWSIADMLDATVEEAIEFLSDFFDSRPAQRAVKRLKLLQEVGLGYLKLGQPINTLSGGESQRLKLVRHLADFEMGQANPTGSSGTASPTLFLFDEPTTGLHFDDIRVLLKVFQRLVDSGHSVIVIEHNLDVIKCADWVIDLGPDAGDFGGQIVAKGTPEDIAACKGNHTAEALRPALKNCLRSPTKPMCAAVSV